MQTLSEGSESSELRALYLELLKRKCKTDLPLLMEEILGYKNLAPIHREVATSLMRAEELRRGLYLLPRGHLKSTMITVSYVIQKIIQRPDIRILITNALLDNSKAFLREIKSHFEKNEKLRALYGDYVNTDEKWSETQIITGKRQSFNKEPTIQVTSVDKSVVSQHYDLIIADDLVTRDSISTKEQRTKLIKYYKDLLDLLEPGGTLLVIGTRWHYDDLYGWLLNEPGKREIMVRRVLGADGSPIFPQKFTQAHIAELKREKGSYEFNAQYNNDPISEENADFKREDFRYFRVADFDQTNGKIYITIDPAISKDETADYTGIVVNLVRNGEWHILEGRRIRLNPTELIDEILYLYHRYGDSLAKIGIEQIMYTQAIDYDITRRMRETKTWFRVELIKHRGRKKEDRIRALIPLFERGNIRLSERCTDLEDELTRFPGSDNDDILDALAYQLDLVEASDNYVGSGQHQRIEDILILPRYPRY